MSQQVPVRVQIAHQFISMLRQTRPCRRCNVQHSDKERAAYDSGMDVMRSYFQGETFSDEPLAGLSAEVVAKIQPPPPEEFGGSTAKLRPHGGGGGSAVTAHYAPASQVVS